MPYLSKSWRHNMKTEAIEKFTSANRHRFVNSSCFIIFVSKRNFVILNLGYPLICNSNSMTVSGQIFYNIMSPSKKKFWYILPILFYINFLSICCTNFQLESLGIVLVHLPLSILATFLKSKLYILYS